MGKLRANSSLIKTNKISIKRRNLGGGKVTIRKVGNYSSGIGLGGGGV